MTQPLRLCVRRTPVEGAGAAAETESAAAARGAHGVAVRVAVRVPSDITCVEEAVLLVTRHCLAGVPASPRVRFRLQVALSEALANAIIRGNQEDSAKSVFVEAEVQPDRICVTVTDEGRGFDPATIPDVIRPDRLDDIGGRGLFLIRKLVDDVTFNERGNSICMTLRRP